MNVICTALLDDVPLIVSVPTTWNELVMPAVRLPLLACSVYVPGLLSDNPLNVATPALAAALSVPASVLAPGLLARATVTLPLNEVSTVPKSSSAATVMPKAAPGATVAGGADSITRCVATPSAVTLNGPIIAADQSAGRNRQRVARRDVVQRQAREDRASVQGRSDRGSTERAAARIRCQGDGDTSIKICGHVPQRIFGGGRKSERRADCDIRRKRGSNDQLRGCAGDDIEAARGCRSEPRTRQA